MSRRDRRLHRHLEAQLRDRRPGRLDDPADIAAARVASALRAEHPGTAEPTPHYVDELARRLRAEAERGMVPAPDRRRFLTAAAYAAAATAVGVGAGVGIDRLRPAAPPQPEAPATSSVLEPDDGVWVAVATTADIRPTSVQRFTANGVEGWLVSTAGAISALSAICTDQGCVLTDNAASGQFVCPCHGATFARDGVPTSGSYTHAVTPLPRIQVRVGTEVEVFVPRLV